MYSIAELVNALFVMALTVLVVLSCAGCIGCIRYIILVLFGPMLLQYIVYNY